MVQLSDIKPLFHAASFFGCGPHLVTEDDVHLTKLGLLYSSFWALGLVYFCCYGLYLIGCEFDNDADSRKILALTALRTVLAYVCFFVDGAITLGWNERLRSALLQLRNYDMAINYPSSGGSRRLNYCCCWAAVGTIFIFWMAVGYITYECELTNPLFNAITYVIANAAISMQLIKFAGLLLMLRQRFRYLRELLRPEAFAIGSHVESQQKPRGELRLQDVWWLHCTLVNAANIINSLYSSQLLFWIATMWLNALSRIYAIIEIDSPFLLDLREALLVTACVSNLFIISVACHATAQEANSVGKAIFMPQATLIRKRSPFEHSVEVGMYFSLRQLRFSAASGFIQVDLSLLLSIAGTLTTYLVVLHNNS